MPAAPAVTFREFCERQEPYLAAVREAGDLPWFEVGHPHRAVIVAQLGLPDDIEAMALRRALWERRYSYQPLPPPEALETGLCGGNRKATCGNTTQIPA